MREFRAHHSELAAAGLTIAGVSRDAPAENRRWVERLALPYPILSDSDGALGGSVGVLRNIRLGGWTIKFLRRSTLLADSSGLITAVWSNVRLRGHALEVLAAARGTTAKSN